MSAGPESRGSRAVGMASDGRLAGGFRLDIDDKRENSLSPPERVGTKRAEKDRWGGAGSHRGRPYRPGRRLCSAAKAGTSSRTPKGGQGGAAACAGFARWPKMRGSRSSRLEARSSKKARRAERQEGRCDSIR